MRPIILMPIAGRAQRFSDKGYDLPKPMIPCRGRTIIEWSMKSVKVKECDLAFVVLKDHHYLDGFLFERFGDDIQIIYLDKPTDGALTTCMAAAFRMERNRPLTIFTPDAYCRPAFDSYGHIFDGVLSLYPSTLPSCSYSRVRGRFVEKVAEKEVISPYSNTGIYHFATVSHFLAAAQWAKENKITHNGEYYIAPIFNGMIRAGLPVGYELVNSLDCLGTPEELEKFNENHSA